MSWFGEIRQIGCQPRPVGAWHVAAGGDFWAAADPLRLALQDSDSLELRRVGRDVFDIEDGSVTTLSLPKQRGFYVYAHMDTDGDVLYVGSTTNPLSRVANHTQNKRSHWFPDEVRDIEWIACPDDHSMRRLEEDLIRELQPKHNIQGKTKSDEATAQLEPEREPYDPTTHEMQSIDVAHFAAAVERHPDHVAEVLEAVTGVAS